MLENSSFLSVSLAKERMQLNEGICFSVLFFVCLTYRVDAQIINSFLELCFINFEKILKTTNCMYVIGVQVQVVLCIFSFSFL